MAGMEGTPNTKLFYPVTCKRRVGALIATPESVAFFDDDSNGEKAVELDWQLITKITANIAASAAPLLRLTQTNGHTMTFKLETRGELINAKSELKAFWKAAHEVSMRNFEDEEFSESKRDEDDLLFQQQSTPNGPSLSRIDSGIEASSEAAVRESAPEGKDGSSTIRTPPRSNKKSNPVPKSNGESRKSVKFNNNKPKTTSQQLLSSHPILLPRKSTGGHFRFDFSNASQTQCIPITILDREGGSRNTRVLQLEEFMEQEEGYRISKQACRMGTMAIVCGICTFVILAIALVVLAVLLWNEKQSGDEGSNQQQLRGVLYNDDFYAGYYNNR